LEQSCARRGLKLETPFVSNNFEPCDNRRALRAEFESQFVLRESVGD